MRRRGLVGLSPDHGEGWQGQAQHEHVTQPARIRGRPVAILRPPLGPQRVPCGHHKSILDGNFRRPELPDGLLLWSSMEHRYVPGENPQSPKVVAQSRRPTWDPDRWPGPRDALRYRPSSNTLHDTGVTYQAPRQDSGCFVFESRPYLTTGRVASWAHSSHDAAYKRAGRWSRTCNANHVSDARMPPWQ